MAGTTPTVAPTTPTTPTMAPTSPDVGAWLSPTLTSNPGLASDVATTTNDKQVTADVVSHTNNVVNANVAVQQHIINHGTQGFWSRIAGDVTHPISSALTSFGQSTVGKGTFSALTFLGKPLQEVQKDYRFIHAIYHDHGVFPGLLTTLGVAAGAVGGGLLGGGVGAAAGGDIAASALRALLGQKYSDSATKAEDPNYKVSFGRDFSNMLGGISDQLGATGVGAELKNTNKGLGKFVSGATDSVGDYTADPLMILGKASMMIKSGRFLAPEVAGKSFVLQAKYPLARVIPGVNNFLAENSMRAFSPEQMDSVYQAGSNGYTRAVDAIADIGKKSTNKTLLTKGIDVLDPATNQVVHKATTASDLAAGEVAFRFPSLGTEAAGRLGSIITQDAPKQTIANQVHDFLKTNVYFGELQGTLAGSAILPSRTLLSPGIKVADVLRESPLTKTIYKTFSGYMPYSVDPITQKISTEKFRWNSPDAASVIYRTNRFSQNHQYGLEMAGQYATAIAKGGSDGLATARLINGQSTFDTLKALGLPDDNFLVKKVKNEIDIFNGDKEAGLGTYGVAPSERGAGVSDYTTVDGRTANAAIAGWQASDMLPIPDYLVAKRALRDMGLIKSKLGYLDDFVADNYTNKFFKPLALATAGFGLRVASSELLLAASRYGPSRLLQAKIASSAAKAGFDGTAGESHNLVAATMTALGVARGIPLGLSADIYPAFQYAKAKGLNFAAKLTAPEQLDLATRVVARHGADVVAPAVSSGHGDMAVDSYESGQQVHSVYQKMKSALQFRDLPTWTTYSADSKDYAGRYATQLSHYKDDAMGKNVAADIGNVFKKVTGVDPSTANPRYMVLRKKLIDSETQRILDTKAGTYEPYQYESTTNTRWVDQDPRAFAADRVDTVLGLGIGADGTVHHNIFAGLANGESPTINAIRQMPKNSLPAEVAGQQIEPYMDSNTLFNRVIGSGFKKVFNPIINNLAREPLYLLHVGEEYGSMKYAISKGLATPEQALTIAENRAVYNMLPQIHNTMLKTQFASMARNFLPFYFAQEQAWKRSLLAMKDTSVISPIFSSTVRNYQMVEHLMSDPTFVTKDSNGNSYAHIPVVGEFGQNLQKALAHFGVPMVSGLPISVSGSLSSLKSVIPDENKLPGISPFIAVGGNIVADWFPNLAPDINKALGQSAGRGFWDTVNPNTMSKSIWSAMSPNDQNSAMQNALFGAMSSAFYHNDPGFNPQATTADKEAMIDRIKNNARSILIMKAALNMLSPLAPKVEQVDMGMREEFIKLLNSKGNFPDALLAFTKEHGDSAVSYTISQSSAAVPGATLPLIASTSQWLKDHSDLVHNPSTSTGALYLVPQSASTTTKDMAVYNDLLRQHLRSIRTPLEFMNQMYIAAGDQTISPLMVIHKQRVADMTANQDTTGLSQEATAWSGVMAKMKNLYPTWFATYNSNASKANASVALGQFKTIFATSNAPTNEQAQQVKGLVADYDVHNGRLNDAKQSGDSASTKTEKDNWTNYLTNLETRDPRLTAVINSIFKRLD